MNKPNPLHLPRGQVSPCRGEMLDWHLTVMDHQVLQPHNYGPGNCEVKKNASFSPLVFLFHYSVAHCFSPVVSLLYSGSYRALYHLAFCHQAPCFPWEPFYPPLIFLKWLAHPRFITVSQPGPALRPPVHVHQTPRYKIGFGYHTFPFTFTFLACDLLTTSVPNYTRSRRYSCFSY